MSLKKMIIRCILCVQISLFGYMYLFGKNGLCFLFTQKKNYVALENQLVQIQKDITLLERDIHAWQTNDFYKEKVAREQLQMACKKDRLFYIG